MTAFPPGLDALYRRMIDQIRDSKDAELYKRILAVVSAVYRPITLDELLAFVDMPNGVAGEYCTRAHQEYAFHLPHEPVLNSA